MITRYHSPNPKYTKTYATIDAARKAADKVLAKVPDTAEIKVIITAVELLQPGSPVRFTPMFHLWGKHIDLARSIADHHFFVIA